MLIYAKPNDNRFCFVWGGPNNNPKNFDRNYPSILSGSISYYTVLALIKQRLKEYHKIPWLSKISLHAAEAISEKAVLRNGPFEEGVVPTTIIVENDKILKIFQGYGQQSMAALKQVLDTRSNLKTSL